MDELATYVDAWRACAADVEELLRGLRDEDWSRETDCPRWTVRDVAAHLAAMESELAGGPAPNTPAAEGTDMQAAYTQAGVDEREGRAPADLVEEFSEAVRRRAAELDAAPPEDPAATPDRTPGGIGWDWRTLVRNRVVDLWVHEQDIRRAVGRPGNLDSPGARVTTEAFTGALPFVIAKRAQAQPGDTVVVALDGRTLSFAVGDDGRCRPTDEPPAEPTVRLGTDVETFTVLGAGRKDPLTVDVTVLGDRGLAERILQGLAVTP